jgi:hypothetical protein
MKRRRKAKTVITPRPGQRSATFSCFGLLLSLTLLLSPGPPLQASNTKHGKPDKPYALIFGTVWGPDDLPVYGVTVRIRRAKDKPRKVRWELYSDHHGEFAQRVPAGETDYILSADLKGFKPADGKPLHLVQEVTVHVYGDEREDTGLHLAH